MIAADKQGYPVGAIKDSLNKAKAESTVTLTPDDINFLQATHAAFQDELDRIQERTAATFLTYIAISRHGYKPAQQLQFAFDPQKSTDNLKITDVSE